MRRPGIVSAQTWSLGRSGPGPGPGPDPLFDPQGNITKVLSLFSKQKRGARTDSPIYHVGVECYYIYI